MTTWTVLNDELTRWADEGRTAPFWLRDDDAVEPTPALERLIGLTADLGLPATLAVIPEHTGVALAERLSATPGLSVAVHGWSHRSYSSAGEKKQELGLHRPREDVLEELSAGLGKLKTLYPDRHVSMLVPPWNRISPEITTELHRLGFQSLSVFGPEKSAPIKLVNTHVDLMDWHGARGGRDDAPLLTEITIRLKALRDSDGVMGFLSHHLVHDEKAWTFLARLIDTVDNHPGATWVDAAAQ
ncbi:polysaccharide deacetylase family protein [Rhizobium sp. TRM95796]|uniref:polysaccharide deacetylase family protein n=1 Tax=Rhizobium sp. TRM95796 TaxID=2979862 RepID=UPI0021E8235F|nr:polysaccharide deacetylase family protein [Rhizobium sp. TRM95796]MCV3767604.1 polysaccharide deacetylase family protein [Rhizobium sp. TRM95796]